MALDVVDGFRPLHPGMGQAVAERTILRKKEDGTFETWGEVADRVATGNALLSPSKSEIAGETALLRKHIANASLLMSGRHLQHGDATQPERNMEVFTNCGESKTEFLTIEHGVTTLGEQVGKVVTVRCADGKWREATVNAHGEQELFTIVFKKKTTGPRHTKEVRFTRNHRWILHDGTVTDNLQIGDVLSPLPVETNLDPEGIVHGLIFGDGTAHKRRRDFNRPGVSQGRTYASIRVCKKDSVKDEIHQILDDAGFSYTTPHSSDGDRVYYIGKMAHAKELPFTTDPEYLAGFIHGWWLADGHKTEPSGSKVISTCDEMSAKWLSQMCGYAGLTHISHTIKHRKDGDGSFDNGKSLHIIRMGAETLWEVMEISPSTTEPVFCVEEPVSKSFTLANGLVTGNCSTAPASFLMFYLLLNGSGVGRSYDDALMVTDWDNAPNIRVVLDETHPDFDISAHESVRDAKHKYGPDSKKVMWFKVPDSREGWAKALEMWELAAFEKVHKDKMLILDFSDVRGKGQPIGGMQNRPASGPVPLMNAFMKAASLKGSGLEPWRQAMYVDHYFAECVLVGGARRSARMSTKFWKDLSVIGFIEVKRPIEYDGMTAEEVEEFRAQAMFPPMSFLWSSNNSVTVDQEFWDLLDIKRGTDEYMSEDAKHARKVWKRLVECSYGDGTGEPGIINVDKLVHNNEGWDDMNRGDYVGFYKYGLEDETQIMMSKLAKKAKRMKYNMITNPSMRAGTKVQTKQGLVPIEELEGTEFEVQNLRGHWKTAQCWLSGESEPLYRVTLMGGHEYYCTAEHKWPVLNQAGEWERRATTEIETGDYLPFAHMATPATGDLGTFNDGFVVGWNLGDGWQTQRSDDGLLQYGFIVSDDDARNGVKSVLVDGLVEWGWSGDFSDKTEINTSAASVRTKMEAFGVQHKRDGLPTGVWSTTSMEFHRGLINALFSSDGSVGRHGLVFTTCHENLMNDLSDLLGSYGIKTHKYRSTTVMDGKEFTRFDLKIQHATSFRRFNELFSLVHDAKREKLIEQCDREYKNARTPDRIKVLSVELTDMEEPVWDINVHDDTHCFGLPHVVTGNCGEIALNVLGGYCVIADVVPFHASDLAEAEEAFRVATRALMRVNTMRSLYKKEVDRTNRIGVGMTGVHEFAWKFFQVGFNDLVNPDMTLLEAPFAGDMWKLIEELRTSEYGSTRSAAFWMTLSQFNAAVLEEAKSYAAHLGVSVPHTMTTIKPAGTTSKLFGLCEGWHLPSMAFYTRWVQFRHDDPLVAQYAAEGYPTRELKSYSGTTIVGFPTAPAIATLGMDDKLVTAGEASPEDQYKWLSLGERFYIHGVDNITGQPREESLGNQISYTLKYKPEVTGLKEFRDMMRKYQPMIRACSVMPQADTSAYEYQPEEAVTKAVFEEMSRAIRTELVEDIGKEHVDCEGGACPVDFATGDKSEIAT